MSSNALTRERLEALLDLLASDRRQAALAYEGLRARVARFFVWHGLAFADEAADQVIDRMARRLTEGEEIADVHRYAVGVARNVLRESRTSASRQALQRERWSVDFARAHRDDDRERADDVPRLECLHRCLDRLGPETRRLVLDYYQADRRQRVEGRRRLASSLGVSGLALRVRVHRVRQTLEGCVRVCLQRQRTAAAPFAGRAS